MALYCAVLTLLSSIVISDSLYKKVDCSQLGSYALRSRVRTMFASAIVNRVPREDVNDPLVYQCYLEGLAGLILENPGKPSQLDCPFSLATLPLDFDLIKQHGFNIEIMIGAGIAKWEEFLFRMSAANSFGCNYVTEDRRYRFLCLFA